MASVLLYLSWLSVCCGIAPSPLLTMRFGSRSVADSFIDSTFKASPRKRLIAINDRVRSGSIEYEVHEKRAMRDDSITRRCVLRYSKLTNGFAFATTQYLRDGSRYEYLYLHDTLFVIRSAEKTIEILSRRSSKVIHRRWDMFWRLPLGIQSPLILELLDKETDLSVTDTVLDGDSCFVVRYPTQYFHDAGPMHFDSVCKSYTVSLVGAAHSQYEEITYSSFGSDIERQFAISGAYSNLFDRTLSSDIESELHLLRADSGYTITSPVMLMHTSVERGRLTEGKPFPIDKGINEHGDTMNLFARDPMITLLEVWHMSCEPCMASMKPISELNRIFSDRGVRVLGLDPNLHDRSSQRAYAQFTRRFDRTFPTVFLDSTAAATCNVSGYPTFVLLDRHRIIRNIFTGYSNGLTDQLLTERIEHLLKE